VRHPSSRILRRASVVALLALPVLAAACGDDDDTSTDATSSGATEVAATAGGATAADTATTAASADTEAASTTAAGSDMTSAGTGTSAAAPAGEATVMVADTDLGEILVDGEGRTLYLFTPDEQGPSVCMDDCLANWPSLTGPATAGEGVDESLLGTATRTDDGTEQVTYNGWPLYYFAADPNPGDINGQGVGDVWFVVDPAGEAVPAG
jgi:predicted lipoprotein with Yx(FWY)xxD motif